LSNFAYASQLGCALDGTTDDAPIINKFFAGASAIAPKCLILDGIAAISGIQLPASGNVVIEGLSKQSTGFKLLSNSYQDGIRVGPYSLSVPSSEGNAGQTPPALNCTNIRLSNFFIDCTGNNTTTPANQPVSGAPAHATFAVLLTNCQNASILDVAFSNPPAYCLCLSNISNVSVRDCSFSSNAFNKDGIHIDGPASFVMIQGCDFATGDDAIALNAPEGYGGVIDTVIATACRFSSAYSAVRIYTSNTSSTFYKVRQIIFADFVGVTQTVAFNFGLEPYLGTQDNNAAEQIEDVSITNIDLFCLNSNDSNTKQATLVNIMNTVGGLYIRHCIQRTANNTPYASVYVRSGATCTELLIEDLTIYRDAHGNGVPPTILDLEGSVYRCTIAGIRVTDADGTYGSIASFLKVTSSVSLLRVGAFDSNRFSAFVDSSAGWQHIGNVAAPAY